jgi:hypothetical protein
LAIGLPVVVNAAVIGLLMVYLTGQFGAINTRFEDTKETLRAEMALGFERLANKTDHLADEVGTLKEMFASHLREHHGVK